jgi:lysozyme family protein
MGITHKTLAAWRGKPVTKADVRALSRDEATAIYAARYWKPIRGDDLPRGLDLVAFDAAVNAGPARGARFLQSGLGVTPDGKIGPQTLAAAQAAYVPAAIQRAIAFRLAFHRSLKTWPTFGKGWTARISSVEKRALEMASGSPPARNPPVQADPHPGFWSNIIAALAALFRGKK